MSLNGQYQVVPTVVPDGESAVARIDHSRRVIVAGEAGATPIPVAISEAVGSLTWTKTAVTMTGSSGTLLAANAARKAFIVASTATNANAAIDITGGTAVLSAGIPLAGGQSMSMSGADCPVTAITQIGTNTNVLTVYEGV